MTRRKPAKPILCPACATVLPPAFIRSSANSLAGSADRPGARGLVRNPTGKGKAYTDADERAENDGRTWQ